MSWLSSGGEFVADRLGVGGNRGQNRFDAAEAERLRIQQENENRIRAEQAAAAERARIEAKLKSLGTGRNFQIDTSEGATQQVSLDQMLRNYLEQVQGMDTGVSDYEKLVGESAGIRNRAVDEEYGASKEMGLRELQELYEQEKERAASEQAVTGRWGSGVGLGSLGTVEASRQRGLANLIFGLTQKRAAQRYSTASENPAQLLAGKQFGLQAKGGVAAGYGSIADTIKGILFKGQDIGQSNLTRNLQEKLGMSELQLNREKAASQGAQDLARQEDAHSTMSQIGQGMNLANTGLDMFGKLKALGGK